MPICGSPDNGQAEVEGFRRAKRGLFTRVGKRDKFKVRIGAILFHGSHQIIHKDGVYNPLQLLF